MKYVAEEDTSNFIKELRIFGQEYGKSWMAIPNGEGLPQFAIMVRPRKLDERIILTYSIEDMPSYVKIFSYTR